MESTSSNGIAQQEQVSVDTAALLLDKPRLFKEISPQRASKARAWCSRQLQEIFGVRFAMKSQHLGPTSSY